VFSKSINRNFVILCVWCYWLAKAFRAHFPLALPQSWIPVLSMLPWNSIDNSEDFVWGLATGFHYWSLLDSTPGFDSWQRTLPNTEKLPSQALALYF
jgi:hypothetical protein